MPFFAMPYRVLFHDTMAYGSHHYLTNFKFQNIARETILFEGKVGGLSVWEEQLKKMLLLTREAYSLNLAPVELGQRVAILLSYEEQTRSTFRLCFRIIRQDGQPVSCGYQTMLCMDKESLELVPAPSMVTRYLDAHSDFCLIEKLTDPSFAERLKRGAAATREIFSADVIRIGVHVANAPERLAYARIIDSNLKEWRIDGAAELPRTNQGTVFLFSGQGSYNPEVLRELYDRFHQTRRYFQIADQVSRQLLGQEFLAVIFAPSKDAHDRLLGANPDVTQIGTYLAGALIAGILMDRGLQPDLLVGHSMGELAALAASGVYSIESGLELVCRRVVALRSAGVSGQMVAVTCGTERAKQILATLEPHSIEIAVINHPKQTVLSGLPADFERLDQILASQGISMTRVESPFPFHSSLLAAAVEPFRRKLSEFSFSSARIPVYHCTKRMLFSPDNDLPNILSRQFVERLDFAEIVSDLGESGYTNFIECGAGDVLTRLIGKNLPENRGLRVFATAPRDETLINRVDALLGEFAAKVRAATVTAATSAASAEKAAINPKETTTPPRERPAHPPIAIVAMGCVLPGAKDPDSYWRNIKEGISGIVDLASLDPNARRDFLAGSVDGQLNIIPDKTYSLLNGTIIDIDFDSAAVGETLTEAEFASLSRGQKLLALALGQSLSSCANPIGIKSIARMKVQCILGATADGSSEFDDAALVEGIQDEVAKLDESDQTKDSFAQALEEVYGCRRGATRSITQHVAYKQVVDLFLPGVNTYVIDSACSSSLYAINLAMKALISGESDVVLAGGVFAPGPANNTLFAQFRGLSASGSRPFDKDADGVIFGDGASIVVLKRLQDALDDGDSVLAVIRGMGLSSDGKSPSINVPQVKGQSLAVRRALQQAATDADTIQYIEAHATATPVGDKVEIESLRQVLGNRNRAFPPIEVGSVKALIGHTGWVSGTASVIKICKAFQEKLVPVQHNFRQADPAMELSGSPFRITTRSGPWPPNVNGYPRRAGVNGFGFGGTNAHLIIEEFDRNYHRDLSNVSIAPAPGKPLVIAAVASLFPAVEGLAVSRQGDSRRFSRGSLRLPKKKLMLPDVIDHMDSSQFLVSLAAEQIFEQLPESWTQLRDEIGVVIGLESKTERALNINKRIFLDRLARLFREGPQPAQLSRTEAQRILEKVSARIKQTYRPSGPYTLPGLMPNVTSSRVSSLFDLKGPNMVIDKGAGSLFQSLAVAEQLLLHGDCKMVLVGGVNALNSDDQSLGEAAFLLALTDEATARECAFPVVATMRIGQSEPGQNESGGIASPAQAIDYRGASGAVEMLAALDETAATGGSIRVCSKPGDNTHVVVISPPSTDQPRPAISSSNTELPKAYAYVRGTPIYRCTPVLVKKPTDTPPSSLKNRKVLVLTDQPEKWSALRRAGFLDPLNWVVALPASLASDVGIGINLESDARLAESIRALATVTYDTILAVRFLNDAPASRVLDQDPADACRLVELLFAVCRHDYDRIRGGQLPVISLSLAAIERGTLHPLTGLTAGLLKSVARELPQARVAIVNTDESNFLKAIRQVEMEIGKQDRDPTDLEVCYLNGVRQVFQLERVEKLALDDSPYLDGHSVVLATGGGRGVTAVLVEELLSRFGCTVIAAGRTDLGQAPNEICAMDESAFRDYEGRFYKEEVARDRTQRIPDLKRKLATYQAANEVSSTIRYLSGLPGSFKYKSVDLTDRAAVGMLIDSIYGDYGRLDLVLHGAGIQMSGALTKKSISDFRRIIAAKLASLSYIQEAIKQHQDRRAVHYHLLTSAFSFMGNDGQPDYGAANEALNRIAAALDQRSQGVFWSSLGWLGWAGIGMTRGSEFAALAASRRLRAITREEGRELFAEMMRGTPATPINILVADGEIKYYGVALSEKPEEPQSPIVVSPGPRKSEDIFHWNVTIENAPFLEDHLVNGIPTMPAAFLTCIAADAARRLRPELKITAYENTHSHRFVRVPRDRGAELRVHARVASENEDETTIYVRILSDFVHKSGKVLQTDILHNETLIRLSDKLPGPPARLFDSDQVSGLTLPDPYVLPGSNVQLNGQFASTQTIAVGASRRIATYQLAKHRYPDSPYAYLLPNMIFVDAFWRFGTVQLLRDQTLGVYVPVQCGIMRVYFDYMDFDAPPLGRTITFRGTNPRVDNDVLHVGPIDASDSSGNVLLVVEQGVCRKYGEVTGSF